MPDNNAAERAIKPIVPGRKNFLFAGSDAGGEILADAMTVIGTAKLSGINPEAYLADILGRVRTHDPKHLDELLPWTWRAVREATPKAARPRVLSGQLDHASSTARMSRFSSAVVSDDAAFSARPPGSTISIGVPTTGASPERQSRPRRLPPPKTRSTRRKGRSADPPAAPPATGTAAPPRCHAVAHHQRSELRAPAPPERSGISPHQTIDADAQAPRAPPSASAISANLDAIIDIVVREERVALIPTASSIDLCPLP